MVPPAEWGISMMYITALLDVLPDDLHLLSPLFSQAETRKRLLYVSASVLAACYSGQLVAGLRAHFMGHKAREESL